MQQALRPYAGAGVALAGAGLIAITPVAGIPLDVQSRAVQLMSTGSVLDPADLISAALTAAQAYPITTPAELVSDTTSNLEALQNQIAADPFPILEQVIANQAEYSNDLATGAENAINAFTSTVQGLPDVFQQAATDFSQGDVFDALTSPSSYLLAGVLEVNHDLLNGFSEVAGGIATNVDNLLNDTGDIYNNAATDGFNSVPIWLADIIQAPLFGPNAALAGFAGVTADITAAAGSGDYTLALSDLANAPSTILDAFLNGYDVPSDTPVPPPATMDLMSDLTTALQRIAVDPQDGFLTGGAERLKDFVSGLGDGRGTIENLYEAALRIASDLDGGREFADVVGTQSAASTDLLSGTSLGLPDFSTLLSDLSTAVSPDALLGDLTNLFDPSAATDIGAQLSTDLSTVLLSLF